jgi:hypothetical protein
MHKFITYLCCDKYLRETTEEKERFILAKSYSGFSSWLAGSTVSGHGRWKSEWSRAAHLLEARKQDRRQEGDGDKIHFKGIPSVTHSLKMVLPLEISTSSPSSATL